MSETCTHTLATGSTCQSPAMRGTSLCFHHTPHGPVEPRQPEGYLPFELPRIRSKSDVMLAMTVVLDNLSMRRIKRSEADTFLRGFSFIARMIERT